MYSLRMSFWTVPRSAALLDALLLGDELVEQEQQRRRCVDRHRRRDPVERDPLEQELHIGERVDRDAGPAHLALGTRIVGVEPELGREVERDREAGLTLTEEVAIAGIRLLGRGEASVLADRPRPSPIHVRVDAAGEGRLSRTLQLVGDVVRRVNRLQLDSRLRQALVGRSHRRVGYLPCR